LEKNNILYTGADAYFYDITTSKITMKKAFDEEKISTPNWVLLNGKVNNEFRKSPL
jgi:D-alanine-D-alanine ligase